MNFYNIHNYNTVYNLTNKYDLIFNNSVIAQETICFRNLADAQLNLLSTINWQRF